MARATQLRLRSVRPDLISYEWTQRDGGCDEIPNVTLSRWGGTARLDESLNGTSDLSDAQLLPIDAVFGPRGEALVDEASGDPSGFTGKRTNWLLTRDHAAAIFTDDDSEQSFEEDTLAIELPAELAQPGEPGAGIANQVDAFGAPQGSFEVRVLRGRARGLGRRKARRARGGAPGRAGARAVGADGKLRRARRVEGGRREGTPGAQRVALRPGRLRPRAAGQSQPGQPDSARIGRGLSQRDGVCVRGWLAEDVRQVAILYAFSGKGDPSDAIEARPSARIPGVTPGQEVRWPWVRASARGSTLRRVLFPAPSR